MGDPFSDRCIRHDKELRSRVKLLGRMLGDVVRSESGEAVYHTVERLRRGYINLRRKDDPARRRRLVRLVEKTPADQLTPVIRAFNLYFQLVNIAEEVFQHRQRRHIAGHTRDALWHGSFDRTLRELQDEEISADELRTILQQTTYIPVFTAHPTEAKRRVILGLLRRVFVATQKLDEPKQLLDQKQRIHAELQTLIQTLWKTEEMRAARPEVQLEIQNGLYYFRESLFAAIPEVYRRLGNAVQRIYGVDDCQLPAVLRFGSWIGGDRDGNPFVTPEVTWQALLQYQQTAVDEYIRRINQLIGELTHAQSFCEPTDAIRKSMAQDEALCVATLNETRKRFPAEPYRRKLYLMRHRLEHNRAYLDARLEGRDTVRSVIAYAGEEELLRDLDLFVFALFLHNGHPRLEIRRLDIDNQAPREPRREPFFHTWHILRRPVAGDNDLVMGVIKSVERVEELFLRGFFTRDKMDIVNKKHVNVTVHRTELIGGFRAYGLYQLISELFT